jgi:MEMO1 family protein
MRFHLFKSKRTKQMSTRRPLHAGSWYEDDGTTLKAELDGWLAAVPDEIEQLGTLPIPGARIIIGPLVLPSFTFSLQKESFCPFFLFEANKGSHAGYAYSGPCAAWAYKALDLSKA